MAKIVGKAVANERAYYPVDETGKVCKIIESGETFDLIEGFTEGKWFTPVEPEPKPQRKKRSEGDDLA